MSHHRLERVASTLTHALADILARRINDPRVRGVHIVSVDMSPDLHLARVSFSTLDSTTDPREAQKGLDSAKRVIRAELKNMIQLRVLPELAFFFDPSIRQGDKMLDLLRTLKPSLEDPPSPETPPEPDKDSDV